MEARLKQRCWLFFSLLHKRAEVLPVSPKMIRLWNNLPLAYTDLVHLIIRWSIKNTTIFLILQKSKLSMPRNKQDYSVSPLKERILTLSPMYWYSDNLIEVGAETRLLTRNQSTICTICGSGPPLFQTHKPLECARSVLKPHI